MMKIEAMTEQEMKQLTHEEFNVVIQPTNLLRRLILTWATAKAEAEMWEFLTGHAYVDDAEDEAHKALCVDPVKHDWREIDFLAAVLERIGWPKEA